MRLIKATGYRLKDGRLVKTPPRAVSARVAIAKSKRQRPARPGDLRGKR